MPQIPNNTLITDLWVKTENRESCNRLYWVFDETPGPDVDWVAFANSVFAHYSAAYAAMLSSSCHFQRTYVRYVSTTQERDAWSTTGPVVGGVAYPPLPDEVCAEIQRRTGQLGRQNRGRIFISGLPSSEQNDGVWSAATIARLKALAALIGPDQVFDGDLPSCHARHWDRKENQLKGVSQARATDICVSRRDRRRPLVLRPV